ncbi:MAG: glycosyl hydrolase, partial [Cyclobacteriaceae bacterium]|nr:glycosyl hydrolase [Cyclobacteriaceae bacterium]
MIRISLSLLCLVIISTGFAQKKKKETPPPPPSPLSDSSYFKALTWRNVGPTRGGRVTAVEGIHSQPSTYYMGSTGGGMWKTDDYGITWKNISDGFFATPSIGAVRVVQSNPKIIYVGTGSDGIRSNVIVGKGMYKSIDAGKTWKHIGLENAGQIGAVEINPLHPDTVFVAAIGQPFQSNKERGVYRTRNGGKSWEQVLYLSDTIGAVDLEFAPNNPQVIYATMWRAERKPWTIISGGHQAGGIYKSVNGGNSWVKLTNGLPKGLIGKIDLAVSSADPNRLYALVEAPKGEAGIYRSDDQGSSFRFISDKKELTDRPFYYCNLEANPLNADVLFVMSTDFFKSSDEGKTWK